jgi:hypothetical protein
LFRFICNTQNQQHATSALQYIRHRRDNIESSSIRLFSHNGVSCHQIVLQSAPEWNRQAKARFFSALPTTYRCFCFVCRVWYGVTAAPHEVRFAFGDVPFFVGRLLLNLFLCRLPLSSWQLQQCSYMQNGMRVSL